MSWANRLSIRAWWPYAASRTACGFDAASGSSRLVAQWYTDSRLEEVSTQTDRAARLTTVDKLRAAHHAGVDVFCGHDPVERGTDEHACGATADGSMRRTALHTGCGAVTRSIRRRASNQSAGPAPDMW
ncbi:hypothetical protein Vau01_107260 [Virgisporangium aurantiacum]|uniref:Uncharacterized protein n=1 Tax=Virgisporangium aurantiacum TaxID=175570 RepID=A0A8J3ZJN1_9ACTN|nr:hypothetical protein Vau01_107260 [Virgisporangium aurantiacum]